MDLDRDNSLSTEIREEMAQSYFAACRRMVDALEELKTFNSPAYPGALNEKQIVRRIELLEEADVYFVMTQREAMGFSNFEKFFGL